MSLPLAFPVKMLAGVIAALSFATAAQAAMPEPPSPMTLVNMSFDQRMAHVKQVHTAVLQSTPQEVDSYMKKYDTQMSKLSPADAKKYEEKRQANANALTPQQQSAFVAQQKSFAQSLTPAQRAELKPHHDAWLANQNAIANKK
ncbi:hypothetical protein [Polynucleobacter sp. JS-Fieb-80-E5]|uniref:hypothetical protein n=1 Tax=Polynucleobacter sp. JS-Fieb-80-E5 TaxID=2081050 RepID=UPI001C0DC1B3|nr:hypothetical protein [Polynucleobacter sp. JS-Fieb-80-E5]MBU3618573.1 hypothetical protein [Polynucleobacter sp. JS-Fieb-80-E5]